MGVVASDSLAAESVRNDGEFAAGKGGKGVMSQPSYSTTTNTADASNATRLDPAIDAEARMAMEDWNESSKLQGSKGLGSGSGAGSTSATGSSTTESGSRSGSAGAGIEGSGSTSSTTGSGPWPKGKNLTEGGFGADAPNASFNNDEGTDDDPGGVALRRMEENNTPYAGSTGPKQKDVTGASTYGNLDPETRA